MTNNLTNALKAQKKSTEQVNQQISGMLGIPLDGDRRVEVPNRNAYVYVRLRNNQSEVIQAYNNQVSPSYNLPVLVERQGNRYVVVSIDTQRYENNWSSFASFLPRHGNTHSFNMESGGGADVVWVESKQLMPLLPFPSGSNGSMNVLVAPYTLKNDDGTWKHVGNTGTQSLAPYLPTGSLAVMGLVYVDSVSGNPYFTINSGTYFSNSLTGSNQVYPYIPSVTNTNTQIPLAGIRLVTGTSEIGWDNIYDVRQWLHTQPTGSAGGGGISSVNVQDEGSPAGTATTFNFVGANVHASVSGSVVRVFVTGAAAGGSFTGDANSVVLTDGAGALDTMPWLKWGTDAEEYVEFGADVVGKEVNAGKMGYNAFGDGYFAIVGAGTGSAERRVKLYDHLVVEQSIESPSYNLSNASNTYNITGSPHTHTYTPTNGWISANGTWTFVQADSPSFRVVVNHNITGTIGLGTKIQLTHQGSMKNFFVTDVSGVTGSNTYLNLYGGTDYTLNVTGSISNPLYSFGKSPSFFPLDPSKWTVTVTDTSDRTQATPTAGTWYNLGSISISIPIGAWRVSYKVLMRPAMSASTLINQYTTLSTANNSESDEANTNLATLGGASGSLALVSVGRLVNRVITLAAKTSYFLNARTAVASMGSIAHRGDAGTTVISAECAYL